jgi:3-oxoacyl-[acyl-carrier protein] reductase
VNNAGVYSFQPLEAVTEGEFHRQYNTNVLGLILATQEALKHFGDEGGSVINISSVVSSFTPPTATVYAGTKGGGCHHSCVAKELGPKKIGSFDQSLAASEQAHAAGFRNRVGEAGDRTTPAWPHRAAA